MKKALLVVGAQWGDEGKGKITNYLSGKADIVIRYQGGDNAGHSVKFDGKTFHLQAVPSGIFDKHVINVLGNGMVVNPIHLANEIKKLKAAGFDCSNLIISSRAHVDFTYHLKLDELSEKNLGIEKIGTTKKGIGPCYTDKISRRGLRMGDFIDQNFPRVYKKLLTQKNKEIAVYSNDPKDQIDYESSLNQYLEIREIIKPLVKDTVSYLANAKRSGKKILFEGAQGTMLDVDFGTYPYVTSSNTSAGGCITGTGIGLGFVDTCAAIVKAYTTRVGEGPFVTEQDNEFGNTVREKAHEFGVVTGRPRRVGYLDLVQLQYSKNVNGWNYIALMLLDILSDIKDLKICTHYILDGEKIDYYPASLAQLKRCKPVYQSFDRWKEDITGCKTYAQLPENAKKYISFIEKYLNAKVFMISVGADKTQTIITEEIF